MPSWSVIIVLAVLASCAVVVVAGYFRGNRKIREAATATSPGRDDRPEPHTESWIWR